MVFLSSGNSLRPFPHSLPYLLVSFLPLWNWLCPLLSADAAVIENTPSFSRALSLSLPDSHWLPAWGDITLLLCLPPLMFPPSLWILTIIVTLHTTSFLPPIYSLCPLRPPCMSVDYCSSCVQLSSGKHNNNQAVHLHKAHALWPFSTSCSFFSSTNPGPNRLQRWNNGRMRKPLRSTGLNFHGLF